MLPLRALVLVVTLAAASTLAAQDSRVIPTDSDRAIVKRVVPSYPDLARRNNIKGSVKIIATVTPSGAVKSTEAAGGNPVLIRAAQDAIKTWKFVPSHAETRETVLLNFNPD